MYQEFLITQNGMNSVKKIPQKEITKVVVYSSDPEQRVVGEFEVLETITMKLSPLCETTKKEAGITREKFHEYFQGCDVAYAFKIGKTILYETPKTLKEYGISSAPQSFYYLDEK